MTNEKVKDEEGMEEEVNWRVKREEGLLHFIPIHLLSPFVRELEKG